MRVLVVDDSRLNLTMVNSYLKTFPEITEIILCNEPEKVMDIIDEIEVDIMLLDVIMPLVSGFDILRMLKNNKKYSDIYVIILTSLTDKESFKTGFELGAYDFINKPINEMEFDARIKVALDLKNGTNNLKKMVEITQKQNQELININKTLKDTRVQMIQSEKMAAIGQLVAGIAHEINNPMGFVNSNFEVMTRYFKRIFQYLLIMDKKLEEYRNIDDRAVTGLINDLEKGYKDFKLEIIRAELPGLFSETQNGMNRITEIIKSLKFFVRKEDDDEKDYYNLLELVNQVITISRNEIKYVSDIEINVPADIFVYCNKVQIGQVIMNIVVNAAQAIQDQNREDRGLITVAAKANDKEVTINILDDGPGISNDIITKIFDPFFTTKDVGKGTGLGLSISYDIVVKKHGGMLLVNSDIGNGAEFIVKLPVIPHNDFK